MSNFSSSNSAEPTPSESSLGKPVTRRKVMSFAASFAGVALLAACGGEESPSDDSSADGTSGGSTSTGGNPETGGSQATTVLNYGEAGSFTTFNPWAQQPVEQSVVNQVFSRLVYKTTDGKAVGDLAESWELAEDGKSMTLKLREGLKWHDGDPLVANDFVVMFGYLSNPDMKANSGVQKMASLFEPVAAVSAPDDTTVVMEFSNPVPYVIDILDYWYAVRFPSADKMKMLEDLPVGTGPFKMTKLTRNQSAQFEPYEDYHVADQPKVDKFVFYVFGNGTNVVSNLQSGQVDGVKIANAANVKPLQQDDSYHFTDVALGVWLVQINVSKPPFDDVKVRQALSYAMDREQFAKVAHFGLEKPVTSPFFAPAATGYVEDLVQTQWFDLDKAKGLLDEAGVKNLKIKLPVPSSYPNVNTMAQIWQSDLAEIGVSMSIHPVDNGRWFSLGAGEDLSVDMVPWNVARCLQDGAVFFAANYGYSGGDLQPFGYRNKHMQELIHEGATITDEQRRQEIYQELNKIVVHDAYNLSTTTFSETWAWSDAVQGPTAGVPGNLILANTTVQR